jgi:hypothetical protein
MQLNFEHKTAGHCENGVVRNLLKYYEVDLSEPMIWAWDRDCFFPTSFLQNAWNAHYLVQALTGAIFFQCDPASQGKNQTV